MRRKIAMVTGGTAGVGRAVVAQLVERGYFVGVIARGKKRLNEIVQQYGKEKVMALPCDVADAAAVTAAAQALRDQVGAPQVWVNGAMLTSFSPFQRMEVKEFDRIVAATFLGQVNGTRAALSVMQDEDAPVIVQIGSGLAYRSVPYQTAYCASKHAINGFSAALRSELIRSKRQVDLSLVQLPAMNTPQFDWARSRLSKQPQPAPPVFQPDVAARAVLRAIDQRPRELFVGGSVLKLVFGTMMLPGWLDRKLADAGAEMQKSDTPQYEDTVEGNLFEPGQAQAHASGSFDDQAKDSGLIVDADLARKVLFLGTPLLTFLLGLLLG